MPSSVGAYDDAVIEIVEHHPRISCAACWRSDQLNPLVQPVARHDPRIACGTGMVA